MILQTRPKRWHNRRRQARLIEEQPILIAALAAALGASVGAALPLSQAEKNLIGETGAKAIEPGRGALANAADVVRKEGRFRRLGTMMSQLADKLMQTDHQRAGEEAPACAVRLARG
jgi:hypothetical protein